MALFHPEPKPTEVRVLSFPLWDSFAGCLVLFSFWDTSSLRMTLFQFHLYVGVCFRLSIVYELRNLSSVPHTWALRMQSSGSSKEAIVFSIWLTSLSAFKSFIFPLPALPPFSFVPLRTLHIFLPTPLSVFKEKNYKSSLSRIFKFYLPGVGV